jgi:hypothetical protein
MIRKIWIAMIIFVPLMPKISVVQLGAFTLLLDDVVLLSAVAMGLLDFLVTSSAKGKSKLFMSRVGIAFSIFFSYKLVNLAVLAWVYPVSGLEDWGKAVMLGEGILVVGRIGCMLCVYLLFFHCLRSIENIKYVVKVYIICTAIIVLIALWQHFILGHPITTATFRNIYSLGIITPTWGTENPWTDASANGHEQLGAFLVMAMSIVGASLLYKLPKSKAHKTAVLVFWMLGLVVLLLSSSRGAWIGAFAASMVGTWLAIKLRMAKYIYRGVLIIIIGLLVLDWTGFDFGLHFISRVEKLPTVFASNVEDDSANSRIRLLFILLNLFEDKVLLGWGAGGAARIAEGQIQRELVEGGIIGTFIFVFLVAISYSLALKARRVAETPFAKALSFGFICGTVGLLSQSLFTELFVLPKVVILYWVVGACVHRMYFIEREYGGEGPDTSADGNKLAVAMGHSS